MNRTGRTLLSMSNTGFHPASAAFHTTEAILIGLDGQVLVDVQTLQSEA